MLKQSLASTVAYATLGIALGIAPQAIAQTTCTVPSGGNGGVVQNGPPSCVVGDVTVGYGTAVTATNSANVTINGAVTAHGYGTGVDANTGSLVIINNSTVRSTAVGATGPITASGLGVSASSGARIEANGISLSNDGGGGAVAMQADNGTIIARAVTINWPNGGGQSLIQSLNGGLIQFTPGSSISNPNGGIPSALLADGVGSRIVADGLTTSMGNAGGITGARAQNGGSITFSGASQISFTGGGGSTGVSVSGSGSVVSADGLVITATNGGGNDVGVRAENGARAVLVGGSINIAGVGGGERGLLATGAGSSISATGTEIVVSGSGGNAGLNALNGGRIETSGGSVSVTNGAGGLLQNGGTAILNGTNVTASGTGGIGFQFNNGGSNTLSYQGGTIQASEASFSVQGALANIDLANTTAIANNNTLLETGNGGNTTYNARNSTLQGVVTTPAGNTSAVSLSQGTVWTMTGNSTATSVTNDASQIIYTAPLADPTQLASYKTLSVTNYLGLGGSIALNTYLGTDGSPSDRLVIIGGQASGSSSLLISNTIGPGDLTQGNGILVVDAINGGTTTAGAFSLGRPVVAGPYEYGLFRGSTDATGPQNWYLRSGLGPIPPDPTPPDPTPDPGPTPPNPTPDPGPTPPNPTPGPGPTPGPTPNPTPPAPQIPNYRREVSLYSALPSMGLIYGRTLIDSLHERMGEQRPLEAAPVTEERTIWCKNPDKNFRCTTIVQLPASAVSANRSYASAGWARIIGTHGNHDGGPWGIFRNGPNFDYDIYGLQAGLDLYRGYNADGSRDHAGVYAAIGRIQGDVRHFNGINAGTNTIDGYSIGAYWTHFGASGWYLDGVVQGTWFDAEADSKRLLPKLQRESFGVAASLEGGYPIALGNGWTVEPQAQLVYQTMVNGSAHDRAALVRFSDVDSLAGRVGARLAKGWALEDGTHPRMTTAWLKASLWNEFLGNPKTSFSSATGMIPFHSDLGGAWAEIRAGIDTQIARNTALYASAGYSIGFDGRSHAYDGRLGIKVSW